MTISIKRMKILTLLIITTTYINSLDLHKKKKEVSKLKAQITSNIKSMKLVSWEDTSAGALERCAIKLGDFKRCQDHIERLRKTKIEENIALLSAEFRIICQYSPKICRRLKREISRKLNCPTCKCGVYCQMRKDCESNCPPLSTLYNDHCLSRCQDCDKRTEECLKEHNDNREVCKIRCPTCEKCKTAIYKERESCKNVCNEKSALLRLQSRVKKQKYIMESLCKKCLDDVNCQPLRNCRFCRKCDKYTNKLARTAKNMLFEKIRQMKNYCVSKCGKCGSLSLKTGKVIKCEKDCFEDCKGVNLNPGVVVEYARKFEKEFGLAGIVIDEKIRKYVDVDLARFEELKKMKQEEDK